MQNLFIANRGEIAVRIAQAAADLGLASVAVQARDEAPAAHTRGATRVLDLHAAGPAAYLDVPGLVRLAREAGCDALHPGYGFLSERPDFAQACADAGLVFVGPTVAQLALLGDKVQALALARRCGVPVLQASSGPVALDEALAFFRAHGLGGVMLKATAGGGGRGMRAVHAEAQLASAHAACAAEAQLAFGRADVYVEQLMPRARHVEVQVVGDGYQVLSLGERECTLQRRFQKLVEVAPSPTLGAVLRQRLTDAALRMAQALRYQGLGTFEFLVGAGGDDAPWAFIEANPRLQVEHTVTEEVTGLDLVVLQLQLARGRSLASLGLEPGRVPAPRGHAIQWRLNAESRQAQGRVLPSEGRLTQWQPPGGPGVRVDSHAQAGMAAAPQFDSLLAKLVVHAPGPDVADALARSRRALAQWSVEGLATNLPLLQALAARPEVAAGDVDTGFVEAHIDALWPVLAAMAPGEDDPLCLQAPMAGRLVQQCVPAGGSAAAGDELAVLEAMKMEHLLPAQAHCRVRRWAIAPGAQVSAGDVLAWLEPADAVPRTAATAAPQTAAPQTAAPQTAVPRADLRRVLDRQARTLDAARSAAAEARHAKGLRTARENLADLCDEGSFNEYGALAFAAQRSRRSEEDLIAHTPADGLITGTGTVNAADFGPERARTAVLAYDATVLAGTQGFRNHQKTDRLLDLALRNRLPVVLFAEGGGGRPGDTDMPIVAGLHVASFAAFARLSGQVPTLGIAAGRCFAGNAALLGCCDLVIATRGANIGMGGPAMIEGGGLGVFKPEQVGPAPVLAAQGVVDLLVADEAEATARARQLLGLFQGTLPTWAAPDGLDLRHVVPENRLRVYDMRRALQGLFDSGSVLELRPAFGQALITAFARLEGRAVGVLASNPAHLGGAIDPDAADKGARFLQLCNAHGLPVVSLIDTPGFMVGPAVEAQAQVRHACRLFVTGAALRVPVFSVVLRKGYGLGAMALAAGGFHAPDFTVAWPTGEFGGMGLEGAVRLGYRKELAALEGTAREALFQQLLAQLVASGGALNMAATLEIDAVIDPADTRAWLLRGLAGAKLRDLSPRFVDTW
jgi:acetyl/propionyl-CoA carboxylase alpha subunit/acetyl-CoA carboxylase carboxyltransferase component